MKKIICKLIDNKSALYCECNCKNCYKKQWYQSNKQRILQERKEYAKKNKENIQQYKREWALANSDRLYEKHKDWREKNKERLREKSRKYVKNRRSIDPIFRFISNLRRRLNHAFKGENKSKSTIGLLGCSLEYAFNHISSQFQPGMSWDNYGKWHVDHIIPLCTAKNKECLEILCHYTNLQPLWARDNLRKNKKSNANLNIMRI